MYDHSREQHNISNINTPVSVEQHCITKKSSKLKTFVHTVLSELWNPHYIRPLKYVCKNSEASAFVGQKTSGLCKKVAGLSSLDFNGECCLHCA